MSSDSFMENSYSIDSDLFEYRPASRELFEISGEYLLDRIKDDGFSHNEKFDLRIESYSLELAYAYNKILSLSNSRTRILAHQVESTHLIVNSLHQRFVIADEVGLGKTVEAGLVIKELIYRSNISRVIIIAPASLLVQWQHEMEEKFGESFELIDRKYIDRLRREGVDNPWTKVGKAICSIDFIKNGSFAEELKHVKWDAVIFDEAHRLRRDALNSTLAYNMAEMISERTRSMILLTATPFRGKLEELYYLIRLVDRNLLGPYISFYNEFCMPDSDLSRLKSKLSSIMIRRTKKEIGGFTVRHARTIRFELYPEERDLYEATTKYVAEEFNKAMQSENRAVGFIMTVFQKLLDSSSYALHRALINRREHLKNMLMRVEEGVPHFEFEELEIDDIEEPVPVSDQEEKTTRELMSEIKTLETLITLAGRIKRNKKGEKLLEMISSLKKQGYEKFLIFTQFKTTQDYLVQILEGYKVAVFHGSMNKDEKEDAIDAFKKDTEVLICTEAGGEGRNMQFCSILFNYDLPWSPLKIEQRIGRIHRFGQKFDVFVYNFSTKGTVAERVLEVLTKKLNLFEESIGTPDIMLGQIEDELKLSSLFMKLVNARRKKLVMNQLDDSVERAKKSFEKLSGLTVAHRLDFNYDEYYRITQKQRKFSNRQLENFMKRYDREFGHHLLMEKNNGMYAVKTPNGEKRGSFDSELALADSKMEFLAFGHPMIDSAIQNAKNNPGAVSGLRFIENKKSFTGIVFFFVITFKNINEKKELVAIFVEDGNTLSEFEAESVEHDIVHGAGKSAGHLDIGFTYEKIDRLYARSKERLSKVIRSKLFDMREGLDLSIDPEIDKIREAYEREVSELNEKLSRQESSMVVTGRDMRSAISRTKKQLYNAKLAYEESLAQIRRFQGISTFAEFIGASAVISRSTENLKDF